MTLTNEQRDNLVTFLKGLMHAGHADGRGCLPLPGISCNTCKDLDRWVAVLTREESELE